MKTVSISGSLRQGVGKKDAKSLRASKMIPCVIYGGKEQTHFATEEKSFINIVFTPEVCFVEIKLPNKTVKAILQDIQYHPINDSILHADFLEITDKPITMQVPIILEGRSPGVLKGGKLALKMRKIAVKALAENMPSQIVLDISKLDIGSKIKVSEVETNNFSFVSNPNTIIVTILKGRGATTTDDSEEA